MGILCSLGNLYILLLFVRIIGSYFRVVPGTTWAQIYSVLHQLTEPVLAPCRRMLGPVRLGGMAMDFSPLIAFFGIRLLLTLVGC